MKRILKISCVCFLFVFIMCSKITVEAEENDFKNNDYLKLVSCENMDNGLTCFIYEEEQNINSRAQSRGYTYYVKYENTGTKESICQLKITVAFTYNNSNGKAKINSQTYEIVGLYNGYSLKGFSNSFSEGDPAVAKLLFTIYNKDYTWKVSPRAYCYNNGSATNSK